MGASLKQLGIVAAGFAGSQILVAALETERVEQDFIREVKAVFTDRSFGKPYEPEIECRHGGSEYEKRSGGSKTLPDSLPRKRKLIHVVRHDCPSASSAARILSYCFEC